MEGDEDTQSTPARIIVGVAAFAILVILSLEIFSLLDREIDPGTCELEVKKHALLLKTGIESFATDIYCPTRPVTIDENDEESIKEQMADEMALCWRLWMRGEPEFFKGDNGIFCHVCSVIDFKDKTTQVPGFQEYLFLNYVKGTDQTYMEYLSSYATANLKQDVVDMSIEELEQQKTGMLKKPIDTSQSYSVVFLYVKGQDSIDQILNTLGTKVAGNKNLYAVGGGVAAAGLTKYFVKKGAVKLGTMVAGKLGAKAAGMLIPGAGWALTIGGLAIDGVILFHDIKAAEKENTMWLSSTMLITWEEDSLADLGCQRSAAISRTGKV